MMPLRSIFTLLLLAAAAFSGAAAAPETMNVAAFGAKGDGRTDDGPAIQKAIAAAIEAGPGAEVALEAGKIYRLGAQSADVAVLRIGNARGLTISGHGAMLVAHPSNRPFAIHDSQDVTVRDLVLDYDPLPFTQARLTGLALAQGTIQFRVEPGYADPDVGGEEVYRDFKSSDAVFLDGATRAFTHEWGRLRSVKALGDHRFEATFHYADLTKRFTRLKTGDFIAIKRHFKDAPARRDQQGRYLSASSTNIYTAFSHNVHFERVTSYAAPGMTFVATGSEGVTLDGCKVIRKPGTDRLIASCSDGAHLKSLTVMPRIRNSVFEALMDDSINIKISSEVVQELQGTRVRLAHGDIVTDDLVIEPGQSLAFFGGPSKRFLGNAKVLAVKRLRYRNAWVTLDAAVPALAAGDLAFLRPVTDAVVSNCEFHSQLKTALLTHPPTMVSGCLFADVAYGVHAFSTDRIEGPPPTGIRIAQCEFIRPSVSAIALHLPTPDAKPSKDPSLSAERCQITVGDNRGAVLTAYNQDGMVLRNVQVKVKDGRARADLVRLRNCANVREEAVAFTPLPRKVE